MFNYEQDEGLGCDVSNDDAYNRNDSNKQSYFYTY